MKKLLKEFSRDERGVSAMEYAILASIVVLALVGVAAAYRTTITGLFSTLSSQASTAQKANGN
ncbi:Flp family type IVb pilin [Burkholderia sp. Ac-20379]|uniref:Flp family type IVb pilin n=1 Tax=Burkholderia sp. Ac-20379 TaxID=2703900 RepID=UPI0019822980|nr:Flp family type IVb pilin [Burkholderia sp. Ac-20379]MBN3726356.1 Flp family type IVb pilin [Burkholderia sp. Ac-20379]